MHVHPKLETRIADLILQRQTHELRLMMTQGKSELGRSLQTDRAPTVLDIAQVRARDAEALSELSETFALGLTNR